MWKIKTPAPLVKVVYIWNVDFFYFGFDPPPPLLTFSTICDIFFCECSPYCPISIKIQTKYHAIEAGGTCSLVATMHQFQCCRGLYYFQMSLNGVCIRSIFEQKIGPYKVCIFVNVGPCGKVAALNTTCTTGVNIPCGWWWVGGWWAF